MAHDSSGLIRWPERYHPDRTGVFVSNELHAEASPPAVWAWLIRARLWPDWYPNAHDVTIAQGTELSLGTRFRWRTFGVTIASTVMELVPNERIAWDAHGLGVDAYHAWLIQPTATGCRILTEETQNGALARLSNWLMPRRMSRYHQIWLERLATQALHGPPPEI